VGSFGSLSQYERGKIGCTGGTKRDTKSRPSTLIIGEGATCGQNNEKRTAHAAKMVVEHFMVDVGY